MIKAILTFSQDTIIISNDENMPVPFSEALINDSISYLSDENGRLIINKNFIHKIEIFNDTYSDTIFLINKIPKKVFFQNRKIFLDEIVIHPKNVNSELKRMSFGKKKGSFKFISGIQIITQIESKNTINIEGVNLFYKKGIEDGVVKISFFSDKNGIPGEIIYTQNSQLKKGKIMLDQPFICKDKIYIGFSWLGSPNTLNNNEFLAEFQGMEIMNQNPVFLKSENDVSFIKQEKLFSFVRFELLYSSFL